MYKFIKCLVGACNIADTSVVTLTKEVYSRLADRPLFFNGGLANRGLTSLVNEATGGKHVYVIQNAW